MSKQGNKKDEPGVEDGDGKQDEPQLPQQKPDNFTVKVNDASAQRVEP